MSERLHYKHTSIKCTQNFRKEMTEGEQTLWSRLRGNQLGFYFRRQAPIGISIVDFICRKQKIIAEVDGFQHFTNKGKSHDRIRDNFLKGQGFRILRFDSTESLENTAGVLKAIYENLQRPLKK